MIYHTATTIDCNTFSFRLRHHASQKQQQFGNSVSFLDVFYLADHVYNMCVYIHFYVCRYRYINIHHCLHTYNYILIYCYKCCRRCIYWGMFIDTNACVDLCPFHWFLCFRIILTVLLIFSMYAGWTFSSPVLGCTKPLRVILVIFNYTCGGYEVCTIPTTYTTQDLLVL